MSCPTIVQVTNISPQVGKQQMTELFSYLGDIEDLRLFPEEDSKIAPSKVCFVNFKEVDSVSTALHLTNTIFIDRALVISRSRYDSIPGEDDAMSLAAPAVAIASNQNKTVGHPAPLLPTPPSMASLGITNSVGLAGIAPGVPTPISVASAALLHLAPPTLPSQPLISLMGMVVPTAPPLTGNVDPTKIEEIRRTVYVGNLNSALTADQVLNFFLPCGEIKYVRMAGDETQPTRFVFVEFARPESVPIALQYNGAMFGDRPIKVNHSKNAIVKPQGPSAQETQREVDEAMRKVKEATDAIAATIENEKTKPKPSRSRSKSRSRSRSKSRRRRSRSRDYRRRSRSRSPYYRRGGRKDYSPRRRYHSRSKSPRRSPRRRSRSPLRRRSRSPRKRSWSRSPRRRPSPLSRSPRRQRSPRSRSPLRRRSRSPIKRRSPIRRRSRSPRHSRKVGKSRSVSRSPSPKVEKRKKRGASREKRGGSREKRGGSRERRDVRRRSRSPSPVKSSRKKERRQRSKSPYGPSAPPPEDERPPSSSSKAKKKKHRHHRHKNRSPSPLGLSPSLTPSSPPAKVGSDDEDKSSAESGGSPDSVKSGMSVDPEESGKEEEDLDAEEMTHSKSSSPEKDDEVDSDSSYD